MLQQLHAGRAPRAAPALRQGPSGRPCLRPLVARAAAGGARPQRPPPVQCTAPGAVRPGAPAGGKEQQPEEHHAGLTSVWEEHELQTEAPAEAHPDSLLNHPTGQKPAASSYDDEWAPSHGAKIKVPANPAKQGLTSAWEEHELEEEAPAEAAGKDSLLNHPTGQKPAASSY